MVIENKGIEYRPKIKYELEDVPPSEFRDKVVNPKNYIDAESMNERAKELGINIDFLIKKSEEKLSNYQGFQDYKPVAVKKYYCKNFTTEQEDKKARDFEGKLMGIDGDEAIDVYIRLLQLKRENENDLETLGRFYKIELDSIKKNIERIVKKYKIEDSYIDELTGKDGLSESQKRLKLLNKELIRLQDKRDELHQEYNQHINTGNEEKALSLQDELAKISRDIDDIKNSLGYTANQSYALSKKLDSTEGYVQKLGYMLMSTPYDNLSGTVCCMIKLMLKQVGITNENLKDLEGSLIDDQRYNQFKNAIDGIRGIMALAFRDKESEIVKALNEIKDLMNAPAKALLGNMLSILREFEYKVINKVDGFFGDIAQDTDNPENILDCLYFEEFADFIYDKIDEIFEDIESYLVDLYKFVYRQNDLFDEDALKLAEKGKTREIYDMLNKLSKTLNTIEYYPVGDTVEDWIENFLIENGYGTTYNDATGTFENIDLGNCITETDYDGGHKDFMPDNSDQLPKITLSNNDEYREFKQNGKSISFDCIDSKQEGSQDYQEELENNKETVSKLKDDIENLGSIVDDNDYDIDADLNYL